MQILKRGLMAAGALALAAMFLNFVAPKSVHAAVAALVQVVNTPANPVPTQNIYEPAKNVLVLSCFGFGYCVTGNVPAGSMFVLDSVSVAEGGLGYSVILGITAGGADFGYHGIPVIQNPIQAESYGTMNLTLYADPGHALTVETDTGSTNNINCIFYGHLVQYP